MYLFIIFVVICIKMIYYNCTSNEYSGHKTELQQKNIILSDSKLRFLLTSKFRHLNPKRVVIPKFIEINWKGVSIFDK